MNAAPTDVISADEMDSRLAGAVARLFKIMPMAELARQLSQTADPITGRVRRITPQGISKWARNRRIPADRCLSVESVIAAAMTRYDMRPDVFGPAEESKVA